MLYNFSKRTEKVSLRVDKTFNQEKDSLRYLFITSCIRKFIPGIDDEKMAYLIRNILTNQAVAWEDQHLCSTIDCLQAHLREPLPESPTIFCAFHFSSYRLGLFKLLSLGRQITIVASDDIIKTQGELIIRCCHSISNTFTGKIINANSPFSIRQMLRELQDGNDLFIYTDGNTGTDGMSRTNSNLTEINILKYKILARTGVAFLSYLSHSPIVPIIVCRYDNEWPLLEVYPPIFPDKNTDKNTFCAETMNKLYSILDYYLQKYPEQWEPWLYLYKFIPSCNNHVEKKGINKSGNYMFNKKRYTFVSDLYGNRYLFDKDDISAVALSPEEFSMLQGFNKLSYSDFGTELNRFIDMEVLV